MNWSYVTLEGVRIEFSPREDVDVFLSRLAQAASDAAVTEQDLIAMAYATDNPILNNEPVSGVGVVTSAVLADPAYAVMNDLLRRRARLPIRAT